MPISKTLAERDHSRYPSGATVKSIRRTFKFLPALLLTASVASASTSAQGDLSGEVTSSLTMSPTTTSDASAHLAASTNDDQGLTWTMSSGDLAKSGGQSIAYKVLSGVDGGSQDRGIYLGTINPSVEDN